MQCSAAGVLASIPHHLVKQIVPGVKTLVQSSDQEHSLRSLQMLLEAGVLSKAEFDAKRAKLAYLF